MGKQTFLQKAAYYICRGENWLVTEAKNIGSDLWNFVRTTLDGLWADLKSLATGAGNVLRSAAKSIHDDALEFWTWLKEKAGAGAKWLLIGGAVLLGFWFLPEILEGGEAVGYAYSRKASRSYRRYRTRKARREAA